MNKFDNLKIIAIVLVVIIAVSVGLIALRLWENNSSYFPEYTDNNGKVKYRGVEYELKEDVESYLIIGLDKYEDSPSADSHESGIQADFILVMVANNETREISAIQINRDTMTKVNMLSVGGTSVVASYNKQIAVAYNYVDTDNEKIKCGNVLDSVEYLLKGVNINHYLAMTMDAVAIANDYVGGVEVEVLDDFAGIDDTLVKGELVTLTGEQALRYVRSRKGLEDNTNISRMERQKQYVSALYKKYGDSLTNDAEFSIGLLDKIDEFVVYDMSEQRIQMLSEKYEGYEFTGFRTIEGELKEGEEFLEFYPNEDSIWDVVLDLFYKPVKN